MSATRKTLRIMVASAGVLAGLAVVAYVVMLAINWRDQPASEQAHEFYRLIESAPDVDDEENAFLYLIGIRAEPPGEPMAAGKRLAETVRHDWDQAADYAADYYVDPGKFTQQSLKKARVDWHQTESVKALAIACGLEDPDSGENGSGLRCAEKLRSPELPLVPIREERRWLQERYAKLLTFEQWRRVRPPEAGVPPFPLYTAPMGEGARVGQFLYLSEAIRASGNGNVEQMKENFARDARFWRNALASSEDLVWRRVAEQMLRKNLLLLNQGLQTLKPERVLEAVPPIWREPLSRRERSLRKALAGELRAGRLHLEWGIANEAAWWERPFIYPFFQVQHAENALARRHARYVQASERSRRELGEWLGTHDAVSSDDLMEPHPFGPLYNSVGRYYFSRSDLGTYLRKYIASVAEVEAARVALLAAARARARHQGRAELEAFFRNEAPRNPLTGGPQGWDPERGVIGVEVPRGFEDNLGLPELRFPIELR